MIRANCLKQKTERKKLDGVENAAGGRFERLVAGRLGGAYEDRSDLNEISIAHGGAEIASAITPHSISVQPTG